MHPNAETITAFYTAFQNKDASGMNKFYSKEALFNDAVFTNLNHSQVTSMWSMLLGGAKDLSLVFSNVKADDKKGSARWVATYTFSKTGNKVVNVIDAEFEFDEEGKIKKHTDSFNFHKWAKQALGFTGLILGWSSFLHNKVRATAKQGLDRYMEKKAKEEENV